MFFLRRRMLLLHQQIGKNHHKPIRNKSNFKQDNHNDVLVPVSQRNIFAVALAQNYSTYMYFLNSTVCSLLPQLTILVCFLPD